MINFSVRNIPEKIFSWPKYVIVHLFPPQYFEQCVHFKNKKVLYLPLYFMCICRTQIEKYFLILIFKYLVTVFFKIRAFSWKYIQNHQDVRDRSGTCKTNIYHHKQKTLDIFSNIDESETFTLYSSRAKPSLLNVFAAFSIFQISNIFSILLLE